MNEIPTKPYLLRALFEWCVDNGYTPHLAVKVDSRAQVPNEYVKNGEIVLNISFDATSSLKLGNDFIEFRARFAGTAREIMVPRIDMVCLPAEAHFDEALRVAISEGHSRIPVYTETSDNIIGLHFAQKRGASHRRPPWPRRAALQSACSFTRGRTTLTFAPEFF